MRVGNCHPGGRGVATKRREYAMLGTRARGMKIAPFLVMLSAAMPTLAACVLPPAIEEAVQLKNQPPRIQPDSLTPAPTDGPKVMTTKCTSYGFFATVDDPDPGDTIYWRVFLDYNHQQVPNLLATSTGEATPGQQLKFDVNPNDRRFFTSGKFSEVHIVELFISDRPIIQDERRPYARAVAADGLTDSFVWAIDLNNQDDCITAGPQ
jgi:hypothetical protein